MSRVRLGLVLVGLVAGCATRPAAAPLDWGARWRLVHIDHVDGQRAGVFEGARTRWLARLNAAGGRLPDGRPLFWSGAHAGTSVYFTRYPFDKWAQLDARRAAAEATERRVGKAAVDDYNA